MEIENLFVLHTKIVQNRVVFKFVYSEIPITELRMLQASEMMKNVLDSFHKKEITNICFVFVINSVKMPINMKLVKNFASTFHSYADIINKKLDFTIIQSNNNIFRLFFSLFKMYYEPIKPLYMCENDESTQKCLSSKSERSKVANFSDMIK
jgi:hypothetical protein|tara:strand:- start:93 stop:548 length:456 start_codon:yes stop_codon:yes gene_type:complete